MAPPWAITTAQRPNLPRAHASLDGEVCGTMWKRGMWYRAQSERETFLAFTFMMNLPRIPPAFSLVQVA